MALSTECAAELQGIRGKMVKLRTEAENANERADTMARQLQELTEKLDQTEKDRDALQRQSINLNDQLFNVESQLRDSLQKLDEADSNNERLLTEAKGLTHRLNVMDDAEELYKQQLAEVRDQLAAAETENAELKRNTARFQMDTDKLDQDVNVFKGQNEVLMQNLKETEDRLAELTSSYNQLSMENRQLEHQKRGHHHHQAAVNHYQPPVEVVNPAFAAGSGAESDRMLKRKVEELEAAVNEIVKRDSIITKLENEINIYQANHKMLTDQLREVQQVNIELRQQTSGVNSVKDQLNDAKDQLKALDKQLTESENRNSQWEIENEAARRKITELEQQLNEQKAAYGILYSKMNQTIQDIQLTTENQGECDF